MIILQIFIKGAKQELTPQEIVCIYFGNDKCRDCDRSRGLLRSLIELLVYHE